VAVPGTTTKQRAGSSKAFLKLDVFWPFVEIAIVKNFVKNSPQSHVNPDPDLATQSLDSDEDCHQNLSDLSLSHS